MCACLRTHVISQGEADAITREVLALPVPPLTQRVAEGRVICALLAAGMGWEIERVRAPLDRKSVV